MYEWEVDIEVWPYSTNESAEEENKRCGGRKRNFYTKADDIAGALKIAKVYTDGIKTNPAVWKVNIFRIAMTK